MAPRIFFLFNTLILICFLKYETIEAHARAFLVLIVLAIAGVSVHLTLKLSLIQTRSSYSRLASLAKKHRSFYRPVGTNGVDWDLSQPTLGQKVIQIAYQNNIFCKISFISENYCTKTWIGLLIPTNFESVPLGLFYNLFIT